jgi:PAS domain S-box-containing protein
MLIDVFLLAGFVINVVFAVLMASLGRDVSSRLKVLMENSRRVVAQEELQPLAKTDDEIGQLDQVLRESAQMLSMARAQEKAIVEHLRSVFEAMPLALLVVGSDGMIVSINQAAENHFDATADKLISKSAVKLFKQRNGEALHLSDFLNADLNQTMKVFGRKLSGDTFPAEVIVTEYNTRELSSGRLLICADVSREYEIEKLKQSFIAMVSHELRSPLMSVNVCLEMLERGFLGELTSEGSKTVSTAGRSVQRLISLVNEILDAERLESGSISILPENLNLKDVFSLSVSSISAIADNKGIKIDADEPDIELEADSDRLVQVLVNFLSNAIKFSPEGATVQLKAKCAGGQVEVSVIDQGRGIPAEHLELIFERFHQVEHDDAKLKGGTGLGLAIARAIVDGHHGKIGVESKIGEGSRFWFTLPLKSLLDQ